MTGQKNRYSTLEKICGLEDDTLKTPRHDEMVLELMNLNILKEKISLINVFINSLKRVNRIYWDNRVILTFIDTITIDQIEQSLIDTLKSDSNTWSSNTSYDYYKDNIKDWSKSLYDFWSHECPTTIKLDYSINSEVPILTSNKFIVGYWDLFIIFRACSYGYSSGNIIKDEYISNHRHLNLLSTVEPYMYLNSDLKIAIEVKPKIDSFGAVLRQLNTYREFMKSDVLVYLRTDDLKFKEAFENQGIKVI